MKAFSFNILLLHYVCREGFLQPVGKQVGNIVKTSEKFLAKELITAYGINVYQYKMTMNEKLAMIGRTLKLKLHQSNQPIIITPFLSAL